ncbi:regulator of G-protein signaling 7 isoform X2 [Exaiptasia diaphana]|uniref:Regulator of G-protein signaling 7 n=1 Tax=Exaiptasia diaphana TaxID=2652724 RepID=A0A913XCX1_EXADI|nr:regulator of G-protein signaling 7 isoform X2 [Exaiptasia diaphana]
MAKMKNTEGDHEHEEPPHGLVCSKMEKIIQMMQDEKNGVAIRTVKSFMSKIPSVLTGSELIDWMVEHLGIEDRGEGVHLASLLAAYGYVFSITDHHLMVKDDGSYYRFQTPYFWLSNYWEPENIDYAVYLCKRTMQNKSRLELDDYEAENLAKLQRILSWKWDFIFMQAEAQAKVDKKRDKMERQILDSQERAFWNVHRPPPGCVSVTEVDIKKACKTDVSPNTRRKAKLFHTGMSVLESSSPAAPFHFTALDEVRCEVQELKEQLHRRRMKTSQASENLIQRYEQYSEYDSFVSCPEPSNPWITDDITLWEQDKSLQYVPPKRVKRWGFSLSELLQDPLGRRHFTRFLEKEFSAENLGFWLACEQLKATPVKHVPEKAFEIFNEYLSKDATSPINVDCKTHEEVELNLKDPGRYMFDAAQDHIFQLMKSDSYSRFLRSEQYKELVKAPAFKQKSPLPTRPLQNLARIAGSKS